MLQCREDEPYLHMQNDVSVVCRTDIMFNHILVSVTILFRKVQCNAYNVLS